MELGMEEQEVGQPQDQHSNTESKLQKKHISRKAWSHSDDKLLRKAIQEVGTNWLKVASLFQNRNPSQCAQRWKRIKPAQFRNRKPWTTEEDCKLLLLVERYQKNWQAIAKLMPDRTGKQVRERFINKLNPEINRNQWSKEEDLIILDAFQKHGSKWTEISKLLQGRPENTIKNRFYSHIRKHYMKIENPYYVVPEDRLELTQLSKKEKKTFKASRTRPNASNPGATPKKLNNPKHEVLVKEELDQSQGCQGIKYHLIEDKNRNSALNYQFQTIQQGEANIPICFKRYGENQQLDWLHHLDYMQYYHQWIQCCMNLMKNYPNQELSQQFEYVSPYTLNYQPGKRPIVKAENFEVQDRKSVYKLNN